MKLHLIRNQIKPSALSVIAALLLVSSPVSASLTSDRAAVDQKLKQQQAQLNQIKGQVNTLQGQLGALDQSIAGLNAQISQNNRDIVATEQQIRSTEAELAVYKEQIGELVRTAYKQGQTSSLEILVGSDSLSDFINKQEYLDNAKSKVEETSEKIVALKNQLTEKQKSLTAARASLDANKQAIAVERAKQAELLAATQGQESEYQAMVEKSKQQKAAIDSQIASLARKSGGGLSSFGAAAGFVKRGQVIGYEGSSGFSTGSHLHFMVYSSGTKVDPRPLINSGQLGDPLPGARLNQGFGPATWANPVYSFHDGLDLGKGYGSPIYAAADGQLVRPPFQSGGFGNYAIIDHGNGLITLYGHMK